MVDYSCMLEVKNLLFHDCVLDDDTLNNLIINSFLHLWDPESMEAEENTNLIINYLLEQVSLFFFSHYFIIFQHILFFFIDDR